jgi:hypothetical protein
VDYDDHATKTPNPKEPLKKENSTQVDKLANLLGQMDTDDPEEQRAAAKRIKEQIKEREDLWDGFGVVDMDVDFTNEDGEFDQGKYELQHMTRVLLAQGWKCSKMMLRSAWLGTTSVLLSTAPVIGGGVGCEPPLDRTPLVRVPICHRHPARSTAIKRHSCLRWHLKTVILKIVHPHMKIVSALCAEIALLWIASVATKSKCAMHSEALGAIHSWILRTRGEKKTLSLTSLRVLFASQAELRSSPKKSLPMRQNGHSKMSKVAIFHRGQVFVHSACCHQLVQVFILRGVQLGVLQKHAQLIYIATRVGVCIRGRRLFVQRLWSWHQVRVPDECNQDLQQHS